MSWAVLRPLLLSGLKTILKRFIGPFGWVAALAAPIVDKLVRPWWDLAARKIQKKQDQKEGEKNAEEIRDIPSDNPDDIVDRL